MLAWLKGRNLFFLNPLGTQGIEKISSNLDGMWLTEFCEVFELKHIGRKKKKEQQELVGD